MDNQFGEWQIKIVEMIASFKKRIYMFKEIKDIQTFLTHEGLYKSFKNDEFINENDVWFAEMTDAQLQLLANCMANKGIKTVNDSKNEGLLEATKYHLEDMRTLLKLNNK